ncbi:MAG: ShlB/FhaC/HecB family hemolysin secretion/activation protein [Vampirovibrionales bacterium]|nr:ShlB/FhaC/HecB family hemolysin secretion/activation protein [Vampirovibrionales bacterium]
MFIIPAADLLGEFGPGSKFGHIDFERLGDTVYFQKNLNAFLEGGHRYTANALLLKAPTGKEGQRLETALAGIVGHYRGTAMGKSDFITLADELRTKATEVGYELAIGFDAGGENLSESSSLLIHVQPLVVKTVAIENGKYFKARSIQHRLGIKTGQPLNLNQLANSIRRIEDNPDLEIKTSFEPIEFTTDVAVTLKINDQRPYHLGMNMANVGLNQFGDTLYGAAVVHNNILGFGDTLSIAPVSSRKGFGLYTHYEVPINSYGTVLSFDHAYNRAEPIGDAYGGYNYKGHSNVISAGLRQYLYGTEHVRITGDAGLQIKNAFTKADGVFIESEKMRNFLFGLQLEQEDDHGSTFVRSEIGWALDILGASNNNSTLLSIPNAGSQHFRTTTTVAREQNLFWDSTLVTQVMAQYTPDSLYTFDQFGAGGFFFGRGYKEQLYGADSVIYGSTEWRVPLTFLPKSLKVLGTKEPLNENIKLVTFLDYTATHLNKQPAAAPATEQYMGTGIGIRAKLSKYTEGRLDLGIPLLQQSPDGINPRLHFGVTSLLF